LLHRNLHRRWSHAGLYGSVKRPKPIYSVNADTKKQEREL